MQHSPVMSVNGRPDLVMERGSGSWLYDSQGRRYLDFLQGWAVGALGHCAPELVAALTAQATTLLTASPAFHNAPQQDLCAKLVGSTGLYSAFLCSSGAEANECAIKLARKWGRLHKHGAFQIITTRDGFHGRTLAAMSASGKAGWESMFPPNLPGFLKAPYGDAQALSQLINPNVCAIMLEPIQGEAGVVVPPPGYLKQLAKLARAHRLLLIFDEIQTGMGRTGSLYRFQAEDVKPDIVTLGKGLGGGVPLAAVVAAEHAACFSFGEHGGTYAGNPLTARCGLAVFDIVSSPEFLGQVYDQGQYLQARLKQLQSLFLGLVRQIRGAGLLWALVLERPVAREVIERCRDAGLLLNDARPNILRLMPSLRVSRAEIDQMIHILTEQLRAVTRQIEKGNCNRVDSAPTPAPK